MITYLYIKVALKYLALYHGFDFQLVFLKSVKLGTNILSPLTDNNSRFVKCSWKTTLETIVAFALKKFVRLSIACKINKYNAIFYFQKIYL